MFRNTSISFQIYYEYPRTFWTLVVITFIDRLGGALIFPFLPFILQQIRRRHDRCGCVVCNVFVVLFAGSCHRRRADRSLWPQGIIIFGLIASSFSTWRWASRLRSNLFCTCSLYRYFSRCIRPCTSRQWLRYSAEERRADDMGILRVAFNLSVTIGPAIGGLLAARSYLCCSSPMRSSLS